MVTGLRAKSRACPSILRRFGDTSPRRLLIASGAVAVYVTAMVDYLDHDLTFFDDRIEVGDTGIQVMMAWEEPLMCCMAELAAGRRGDVLEIGFGMGICATAIQKKRPRSHTIVEAHPQIVVRAEKWRKVNDQDGVTLLAGRWQDVMDQLGTYDGIAFDVFGGVGQRLEFFAHLPRLLRPGAIATLWLGDDRELPADLAAILRRDGFVWRYTRVNAIPDKRCTYSRTNEFVVPAITRPRR